MMLVAIPAAPLVAAIIARLFRSATLARMATVAASVLTLVLAAVASLVVSHRLTLVALSGWVGINPLAALILLLQSFVGLTAAIYSWSYIPRITGHDVGREQRYFVNLNLFMASLFVVPLLLQPALAWVAVELTTLLSVFLVSFDNTRLALEAAWKYAVITIMGATVAVLGIFLLLWGLVREHGRVETWHNLIQAAPHLPPGVVEVAFVLILVGFGAKVGLVPLHTWLPDAHSQAPTPVCALLSGVEVTTVLYVVMRLWPAFTAVPHFPVETWASAFGLISVGVAAFLLLQVHDFKRLFAFSTVEHMGILLLALGLGPLGVYACMYQLLTHGLTKSLAFYGAGATVLATGTREIAGVRGLLRVSPVAAVGLFLGALAIAGAPPFAVFLSELSVFQSALAVRAYVVLALLLLFLAIAFLAIMRHVGGMLFGAPSHPTARIPGMLVAAMTVGWIPVLLLGVYLPTPLHHLFVLAAGTIGR